MQKKFIVIGKSLTQTKWILEQRKEELFILETDPDTGFESWTYWSSIVLYKRIWIDDPESQEDKDSGKLIITEHETLEEAKTAMENMELPSSILPQFQK